MDPHNIPHRFEWNSMTALLSATRSNWCQCVKYHITNCLNRYVFRVVERHRIEPELVVSRVADADDHALVTRLGDKHWKLYYRSLMTLPMRISMYPLQIPLRNNMWSPRTVKSTVMDLKRMFNFEMLYDAFISQINMHYILWIALSYVLPMDKLLIRT